MDTKNIPFEYIKNYYGVPAEFNREILFQGKRRGIIVKDMGNYIGVNFYDEKNTYISTLHPTSEVEYLGIGNPRKLTAGQKRYQHYREIYAEWMSFGEYLKIKQP